MDYFNVKVTKKTKKNKKTSDFMFKPLEKSILDNS